MDSLILVLNPGSTSTKIALFDNEVEVFSETLRHTPEDLGPFKNVIEQYDFRKKTILEALEKNKIDKNDIKIIVGRGGLLRPIESGAYGINEKMKEDLIKGAEQTNHASNLGGLIADELRSEIPGSQAFIADPPVVDEMEDIAHVTGHPKFKRKSIFHALNQKAVAKQHAQSQGETYGDENYIVAHLGGGISVGAHKKGRIVDVNNALDGEGPFSPERSGSLPVGDVAKLCFSGDYELKDIKKMLVGNGGLMAHLGTSDVQEVLKRIEGGDTEAKLVLDAMLYQVVKSIGAMYAVLSCDVRAVLVTGGLAYSDYVVEYIRSSVEKMAPLHIYPGENEMESLALNGRLVLSGDMTPHEY